MNPNRKGVVVERILKLVEKNVLPEFVYKMSLNELLELEILIEDIQKQEKEKYNG